MVYGCVCDSTNRIGFIAFVIMVKKFTFACSRKSNTQFSKFYIRGSVHRNSRLKKSNEMQQYADIYLLLNYSTLFRASIAPIIRST